MVAYLVNGTKQWVVVGKEKAGIVTIYEPFLTTLLSPMN